jgi:hypothetical protein
MELNWEIVVYALLLIDSIGAVAMSWFGRKWWIHSTGKFSEFFPPAKGWSVMYFVLILVIGYLLGII